MTSLYEFLAKKRQERKRGKLAGLTREIQKLKDLGATHKEIAEYLELEHGLAVTRSGIQKHLKSVEGKQPVQPPATTATPTSAIPPEPAALPHRTQPIQQPANAPPPDNAISGPTVNPQDRIPVSEGPSDEDDSRYDRTSPEHLAKVAALRQQRSPHKT